MQSTATIIESQASSFTLPPTLAPLSDQDLYESLPKHASYSELTTQQKNVLRLQLELIQKESGLIKQVLNLPADHSSFMGVKGLSLEEFWLDIKKREARDRLMQDLEIYIKFYEKVKRKTSNNIVEIDSAIKEADRHIKSIREEREKLRDHTSWDKGAKEKAKHDFKEGSHKHTGYEKDLDDAEAEAEAYKNDLKNAKKQTENAKDDLNEKPPPTMDDLNDLNKKTDTIFDRAGQALGNMRDRFYNWKNQWAARRAAAKNARVNYHEEGEEEGEERTGASDSEDEEAGAGERPHPEA